MAKPRKKTTGYKTPEPLPLGVVFEDVHKTKWKLGPSIGKGGFGEIYSAQQYSSDKRNSSYPYVIKVEPQENGPLFVEMHFYTRNAKSADITAFMTEKNLATLGMPQYITSGTQEHNGNKYRFIVMQKFGTDIWKLYLENKKSFLPETAYKITLQILNVLEYIHSKGYVHADIKGANILLGSGKESQNQVYLVDFGLSTRCSATDKPDPKKAHNGTIEYVSRDGHLGVETRRGDLEILGYNLIHWLGGVLPWENSLSDKVKVQKSKEEHMNDISGFLKGCFNDENQLETIDHYMKYINTMKYDTVPDYEKLRKILLTGLEKAGGTLKSPFKFTTSKLTPSKRKYIGKTSTPIKKLRALPTLENGIVKKPVAERKKKVIKQKSETQENMNDSNAGFTAEMLRIKSKLQSKKKQRTTEKVEAHDKVLRTRKKVNYDDKIGTTDESD